MCLTWTLRQNQTLHVQWRESGGPPIATAPLIHSGRGLGLIQGLIESQLHGRFTCESDSEGLRVDIQLLLLEQTYKTRLFDRRDSVTGD